MKKIFVFSLVAFLVLTQSVPPAFAKEYDVIVNATGADSANCERADLPGIFVTQDVCNVQEAVNNYPGGRILLKGTFHFATYDENGFVVPNTDGSVFITNDVEIYGDRSGSNYRTSVKGGYFTFSIGLQPTAWDYHFSDEYFSSSASAVPVKVTVQDIEFDNSYYIPIRIWATTGANILQNRILGGRSLSLEDFFGPGAHAAGYGIAIVPPAVFIDNSSELLSGVIRIEDNYINGLYGPAESGDPWGAPSYGVLTTGIPHNGIFALSYEANIKVINNEVNNLGITGIHIGGNAGSVEIHKNSINMGNPSSSLQPFSAGISVWAQYFFDGSETTIASITKNEIVLAETPDSRGITISEVRTGPVVTDNVIALSSPSGIGISTENTTFAEIRKNRLSGLAKRGVELLFFDWDEPDYASLADGNNVESNKLVGLSTSEADYYLGEGVTNNYLYVKKEAAVIDDSGNDTNLLIRYGGDK